VSARSRTYFAVVLAAAGAVALVVATVAFTRTSSGGGGSPHAQANNLLARPPGLTLDLGVRTDQEARALRRATVLVNRSKRQQAARIFALYHSVQAQVGLAIALWPSTTLSRLQKIAAEHPRNGVAQLNLGLVELQAGNAAAAKAAWHRAVVGDPDSLAAESADNFLHPGIAPEMPLFVPSFAVPEAVARLSTPRQFAALRRAARGNDVRAKLLYGAALQRLGRPLSAEREFEAAARLAPGDAEPLVAAAVGRFSKSDPVGAFARLGPLSGRFPRSQTVRFHLGELLVWIGQLQKAKHQLLLARAAGPRTALGASADQLLKAVKSEVGPTRSN
jgi:tetratricopeptide (TPR) repeat protein